MMTFPLMNRLRHIRTHLIPALPLVLLTLLTATAQENERAANTVILDKTGVENLRIETVTVEEADFEESIFALGRLETIPDRVAAVTSRVPGRISELTAIPGQQVKAGDVVARVESRQPGNPPPTIALEAPLGGMVTQLEARLGDPVEPDRALLEIADLSRLYAVARVPEHYAGRMKPGARSHIRVSAVPEQEFTGTLLRFGTSADVESGTIDVIFTLPNESGLLRPGMRAEFSIVLNLRQNVMSVPRAALQGDAADRFVWVKDFDLPYAFIRTPVVVGQINDRSAEIVNGLFPADDVVTRGAYSLAFVGGGSISLKAALDAAHGHEHNEDGSELTPEQKKAKAETGQSGQGGSGSGSGSGNPFWMIVSGVLFVLLAVSQVRGRKHGGAAAHAEVPPPSIGISKREDS